MERRVLIVEAQNDFALSMATVLRSAGYQTAMANTAAEAQREMEKRRPDLVVLRAELPDQSGFTLCGQIKKGKWGQNLKVLLLSSDTGEEALKKHRETPAAADGYLVIPFEMGELASISSNIIPPGNSEDAEAEASLDSALNGNGPREAPPMPPPLRAPPPGGPPKLPKRERRSAITDEDRQFLDRAFQSIADRKARDLNGLWNGSDMVAPFKNTAFGVLQAVSTARHHLDTVRGATRGERNTYAGITGTSAAADAKALALLERVLAS
jgi:CheY-like chemotaxis protein